MLNDRAREFLQRHGVTWTLVIRLTVVVSVLVVVGIRFERTYIAVATSLAFVVVLVLLGRSDE